MKTIINILRDWNYDFYQKYLKNLGIICAFFSILFYLLLHFFVGYEESLFARATVAILFMSLAFLPKTKKMTRLQKIYLEIVYALSLPILFSYLFLLNNGNSYWFSSLTFCGLAYGVFSHQPIGLIVYPLSAITISTTYMRLNGEISTLPLETIIMGHIVAYTMHILATFFRSVLQLSYQTNLNLNIEKNKKEQIEKSFYKLKAREEVIKKFVRPSILAEIALNKDPSSFEPCVIEKSILFSDMRNFTTYIESLRLNNETAREVTYFLNSYFGIINRAIFNHGGETDKIIGDAVMGIFNDPVDCYNACCEIVENIANFNKHRFDDGLDVIRLGIGVSIGKVIQANFGSFEKLDRSIIGDFVNTSSRLESLTKEYKVDVLVSKEFIEKSKISKNFRVVDHLKAKGKNSAIYIYELYAHARSEVIDYKNDTKNKLEEAIQLKIERRWQDSLSIINELIHNCPPHHNKSDSILDPTLLTIRDGILNEKARSQNV